METAVPAETAAPAEITGSPDPAAAAAPPPADAASTATATPVDASPAAAADAPPTAAGPREATGSIKPDIGAKKAARPRHAATAPKHITKVAKPVRRPAARRAVRRVVPQPTTQSAYSYSNWSTTNAQWARQPAWQTSAQPKRQ
jgi:hypothetical protein